MWPYDLQNRDFFQYSLSLESLFSEETAFLQDKSFMMSGLFPLDNSIVLTQGIKFLFKESKHFKGNKYFLKVI